MVLDSKPEAVPDLGFRGLNAGFSHGLLVRWSRNTSPGIHLNSAIRNVAIATSIMMSVVALARQ